MDQRTVKLLNHDGSPRQWITPAEAKRLAANGHAEKLSARRASTTIYRMFAPIEASESRTSPCEIKRADLEILIGLRKADEIKIERLIGFGLLPPTAWATQSGFIRV